MINHKKPTLLVAAMLALVGCESMKPVQQQSDIELCQNAAISKGKGEADSFFAIKKELEHRQAINTLTITKEDCITAAELAFNKQIADQRRAEALSAALNQFNQSLPKQTTCNTYGNSSGNVYGNTYNSFGSANTTCTTY
ncbi:MAG: hypothetical protein ACJ8LD_01545 [Pantoea agglomerans]